MKSSRQWAHDLFLSVRGRAPTESEADRWLMLRAEQTIAQIKREAFAAGANRYRSRLLALASPAETIRLKQVIFQEGPGE